MVTSQEIRENTGGMKMWAAWGLDTWGRLGNCIAAGKFSKVSTAETKVVYNYAR
jgi:hypothetical protein